MADVYTNTDADNFPGARQRTRPGTQPGEEIHDTVIDASGARVTDKPANAAMLAGKKARLERKAQQEQDKIQNQAKSGSGSGSILSRLIMLAIFLPLLSNFLTGTYHFSLGPTVQKHARSVWRHPLNPLSAPPRVFTLDELKAFDGSQPGKPIYISVNGQVFDVTANPRMYGKGGAYNMMAGKDASRAFITGCFQTHQTHDLRGLSEKDLASLNHWTEFFTNSDKYFLVGTAQLPPIDPNSPIPKSCNTQKGEEAPAHHKQGGHGAAGAAAGAGARQHAQAKPKGQANQKPKAK